LQGEGVQTIYEVQVQAMWWSLLIPIFLLLPHSGDIYGIVAQGSGVACGPLRRIHSEAENVGFRAIGAFRGPYGGFLWFMDEGILWESWPCEFWAVEDLVEGERAVRLLDLTDLKCTLKLTRKAVEGEGGIESEFRWMEPKDMDWIAQWVLLHRDSFGKVPATPSRRHYMFTSKKEDRGSNIPVNDDDEDDEDFKIDSDESEGGDNSDDCDGNAS
jgi:hypothetical protein